MSYLLTQIWVYLLVAFIIGLLLGWLVWGHLGTQVRKLRAENADLNTKREKTREKLEICRETRSNLVEKLSELEKKLKT